MINEFIEKIIVHAPGRDEYGDRCQDVDIYLNFIGDFKVPTPEPTAEELAEEEAQRRKRAANRRKYARKKERDKQIKAGLLNPGEPYQLVCQCCGQSFQSIKPQAKYCNPACRERFYRQQRQAASESSRRECLCANCGAAFTTARKDAKYCSDRCRAEAHIAQQKLWNAQRR